MQKMSNKVASKQGSRLEQRGKLAFFFFFSFFKNCNALRRKSFGLLGKGYQCQDIRDIRKVRKRQHLYPEFGHTQCEIQKKTCKKVH
jgi:hypothetical protein